MESNTGNSAIQDPLFLSITIHNNRKSLYCCFLSQTKPESTNKNEKKATLFQITEEIIYYF